MLEEIGAFHFRNLLESTNVDSLRFVSGGDGGGLERKLEWSC